MNHNFRRLTDLFNYIHIKSSHIYHSKVGTEWCFNDYCNSFNRIYIVLDGGGLLYNEHERINMSPGNIYIIPSHYRYSCRCDDHLEKIFIHFTVSILPQKDLLSGIGRIITMPISKEEIEDIKHCMYEESVISAIRLQSFIRTLVLRVIEPDSVQIGKDIENYRKYKKLFKYIETHLYADISIADACSYTGFSQTYLGQRFKSDTGRSIKQYVSMLFTDLTLSDISKRLHFESDSYFSKYFKKHVGISAREYRKLHMNRQ